MGSQAPKASIPGCGHLKSHVSGRLMSLRSVQSELNKEKLFE